MSDRRGVSLLSACLVLGLSAAVARFGGLSAAPPLLFPRPATALATAPAEAGAKVVEIDQGWDGPTKMAFWFTDQGSRLFPYAWFLALEQAGSERPFRDPKHVDGFRYLPWPADPKWNPDGLPIGFVRDKDAASKTGDWVGLTCAACHTGKVAYKGSEMVVDGAPALADFQAFHAALVDALAATLDDPAKFARFAKAVNGTEDSAAADALRGAAKAQLDARRAFAKRSASPHPYGFARLDAFTILVNEIVGTALQQPDNLRTAEAPVSYPFLWDAPRLDWVQWNGSASNPLARNVGECLGVFGSVTLVGKPEDLFASSLLAKNLFDLEGMLDRLKPPAWPEAAFGKVDADLARTGSALYAKHCASCHADKAPFPQTTPNKFGKSFVRTTMTPLDEVKTDPVMATDFASRRAKPGALGPLLPPTPGASGPPESVPAGVLTAAAVRGLIGRAFQTLKLNPDEQLAYSGYRDPDASPPNVLAYKARPLDGIWATAPYLHNGSVPNLHQLLLPAAKRDKAFHLGSREFDPVNVGFDAAPAPGAFRFDTSLRGNSNEGHEYGTDLGRDDRRALLEYLKTL